MASIIVQKQEINILTINKYDYISLTDMLQAKDGNLT